MVDVGGFFLILQMRSRGFPALIMEEGDRGAHANNSAEALRASYGVESCRVPKP